MARPDTRAGEAERTREHLARLDAERADLEERLAELSSARLPMPEIARCGGPITNWSPTQDKIALFRALFGGREDVFPKRWENAGKAKAGYAPVCVNEWQRGVCDKPRVRCGACPNQAFVPLTDEAVEGHLRGRHTLGVYPILADDTCRFLAADFDKETWGRDADAYLAACRAKEVPAALERSRSGNGAHVWSFFEEPVPAQLARRLGAHLLTEAMERNPDIGFRSYDRFFPSQDTLPQGGFGNLIALPLQGGSRESGNSVFLDSHFEPWPDQWSFLSGLRRLSAAGLAAIVDEAGRRGRVVGLRLPLDDEDEEPWSTPKSRQRPLTALAGALPGRIGAVLADQLYVAREGLPPALVNRLVRLAAFQNPAFYAAQAMRRSTFGTPRVVAVDDEGQITAVYCAERPNGFGFWFDIEPGGIESSIKRRGKALHFARTEDKMRYRFTLSGDDTLTFRYTRRGNHSTLEMTCRDPSGCAARIAPPTPH